jgi:hypothetical protein
MWQVLEYVLAKMSLYVISLPYQLNHILVSSYVCFLFGLFDHFIFVHFVSRFNGETFPNSFEIIIPRLIPPMITPISFVPILNIIDFFYRYRSTKPPSGYQMSSSLISDP